MTRTKNALIQMEAARRQAWEMQKATYDAIVRVYGKECVSFVHDSIEVRIPIIRSREKGAISERVRMGARGLREEARRRSRESWRA